MAAERPDVPAEIEEFLIGLYVRAGQIGGAIGGVAAGAIAGPGAAAGARRGGGRGGARGAARLSTKVEERAGDVPGTAEQIAARLVAAFPRATRLPDSEHVRLAVPVGLTGLQQIVIELEFRAAAHQADNGRVPVRLRGFGKEGLISRKPTRTVTDQAWTAVLTGDPIARIEAVRSVAAVEQQIPLCYGCGKPLDPGDPRSNRPWPDPVADMTEQQRDEHVRFSSEAVVATDNIGGFVRALLPVPLTDGRTATIGVWISVDADVYAHVTKVGLGELDYTQMQFEGRLANSLEPWGQRIFGAPVSAGLPPGATRLQMPHVLGSPAPEISAVLTGRWRAEDVLTGDMRWALNYDPAAPPTPHHH